MNTPIFAERTYVLRRRDTRELDAVLRLSVPAKFDDSDWACEYEITSASAAELWGSAVGIDGVQALLLACRMAEAQLHAFARSFGAELTWLDAPDLGLRA